MQARSLAEVHREGYICPCTVVRITPCALGSTEPVVPLVIRSNRNIIVNDGLSTVAQDTIISRESITSQQVDYSTGQSSISTFNFSIVEENDEFTKWFRALDKCTLRGAKMEYFIGDERLPFEKYELTTTQQLESVQQHHCEWRFAAAGIGRISQRDVFVENKARNFSPIYVDANEAPDPICDALVWDQFVDSRGFPVGPLIVLGNDPFFRVRESGDIYIRVDHDEGCEIMRASSASVGAISLLTPGDVINGVICVHNLGDEWMYNVTINDPMVVGTPPIVSIAPGTIWCAVEWRKTVVESDRDADGVDGDVEVLFSRTVDGTPTVSMTASPTYNPETLPEVDSVRDDDRFPGSAGIVRKYWVAPSGPIKCGKQERPRIAYQAVQYNIVERGMFNTPVAERDKDGLLFGNIDIVEAPVLEGKLPEILYLALTGRRFDDDVLYWDHQDDDTRTPGYSAGIDPSLIVKESFSREAVPELWELSMRFLAPRPDSALEFAEMELLRWASYFLREEVDGRLSLQPLNKAGDENDVSRVISSKHIFRTQQLTESWDQPTELVIAWDWDACEEEYTASHTITNEFAVADNCGQRRSEYCAFQGVRTDISSGAVIRNHMREWLAFRSVPFGSSCIDICVEQALGLRVGQNVLLDSPHHRDRFSSKIQNMSRVVGISSIRLEPRQGYARLCYEFPLKTPYRISDLEFRGEPCATVDDYREGRDPLFKVVDGLDQGDTTWSGLAIFDAGHYYHDGDLFLDGDFIVNSRPQNKTLGIAVSGDLTYGPNFRLYGDGEGFDGIPGSATKQIGGAPIEQDGFGSTTSGYGGTIRYYDPSGDGGGGFQDSANSGDDPPGTTDDLDADPTDFDQSPDAVAAKRVANPQTQRNADSRLRYNICSYDDAQGQTYTGRYFGFNNPTTVQQTLNWELAGNGGAGGLAIRFQRINNGQSDLSIAPLRGGDGGAGGLGYYTVSHSLTIDPGAVIKLNGANGQSPPERVFLDGRIWGGIPGVGGNPGRYVAVVDGQSADLVPDAINYVEQFTGYTGLSLSPATDPPQTYYQCGEWPQSGRKQIRNASQYRQLICEQ